MTFSYNCSFFKKELTLDKLNVFKQLSENPPLSSFVFPKVAFKLTAFSQLLDFLNLQIKSHLQISQNVQNEH